MSEEETMKQNEIQPWIGIVENEYWEKTIDGIVSKKKRALAGLCLEMAAFHPSRGVMRGLFFNGFGIDIMCYAIKNECAKCPLRGNYKGCGDVLHTHSQWLEKKTSKAANKYYRYVQNEYSKLYLEIYGS
jgi:hypothetical protein